MSKYPMFMKLSHIETNMFMYTFFKFINVVHKP